MEDHFDNIEQYLNGTLEAEALRAFEAALEEDPALATEVALHQKVHQVLGNTQELAFRQNLTNIADSFTEADLPAEPPVFGNKNRKTIGGFILLVLLVALAYWIISALNRSPSEPEGGLLSENTFDSSESVEQPAADTPSSTVTPPTSIPESPEVSNSTSPVAPPPIDPNAPNPVLEALLDPAQHSKVYAFDIYADWFGDTLRIEAELSADTLPANDRFLLELFNNLPARYPGRPLQQIPLAPQPLDTDQPFAFGVKELFYVRQDVLPGAIPDGVYYYLIRLERGVEPLFVGKVRRGGD